MGRGGGIRCPGAAHSDLGGGTEGWEAADAVWSPGGGGEHRFPPDWRWKHWGSGADQSSFPPCFPKQPRQSRSFSSSRGIVRIRERGTEMLKRSQGQRQPQVLLLPPRSLRSSGFRLESSKPHNKAGF